MDKNVENKFSENPGNDPNAFWDAIRKRKHDQSFPATADWIRNTNKVIRATRIKKRKRRRKLVWLSISFLSILLIVSCTYRIERVENAGSLVNFGIDKQEKPSFQKLSSLQQLFAFTCYQFLQPGQPGIVSFIFFIPGKEQEKLGSIAGQLKLLRGLSKLDISPVNYNIKESLFSTFLHGTLKVGREERLKGKDLVLHIQTALDKKGLSFLSTIVLTDDEDVSFTPAGQDMFINKSALKNSDSLAIKATTRRKDSTKFQANIKSGIHSESEKLQMFDWLLGTWRVKYVPHQTYHQWMRMSDSSLICFIIKYNDGDDPDISIGFSIKYSAADSAILSLRGIEWKFLSANNKEVNFKNETTPKSANVKWSLDQDGKTWQSVISGERNLEIVNLIRTEDINLENIVKDFIANNPGKVKL